MTRQERLKMNTVTHWKKWAAKHKSKRLAMLDICDRADAIYKLKTLRSWQARTCAMVKTQRDMAYTFQQYWVRRKVFLGFSNLIQKKRWKMQMSALVDRQRLQMWFSFWCTWCSGEAEARDSAAKADGFRRHWLKRTTFNKLLLLVVVNERNTLNSLPAVSGGEGRPQREDFGSSFYLINTEEYLRQNAGLGARTRKGTPHHSFFSAEVESELSQDFFSC